MLVQINQPCEINGQYVTGGIAEVPDDFFEPYDNPGENQPKRPRPGHLIEVDEGMNPVNPNDHSAYHLTSEPRIRRAGMDVVGAPNPYSTEPIHSDENPASGMPLDAYGDDEEAGARAMGLAPVPLGRYPQGMAGAGPVAFQPPGSQAERDGRNLDERRNPGEGYSPEQRKPQVPLGDEYRNPGVGSSAHPPAPTGATIASPDRVRPAEQEPVGHKRDEAFDAHIEPLKEGDERNPREGAGGDNFSNTKFKEANPPKG